MAGGAQNPSTKARRASPRPPTNFLLGRTTGRGAGEAILPCALSAPMGRLFMRNTPGGGCTTGRAVTCNAAASHGGREHGITQKVKH